MTISFYPHYYSTYCIHDLHNTCRLTCKTCGDRCRCDCHTSTQAPTRATVTPDSRLSEGAPHMTDTQPQPEPEPEPESQPEPEPNEDEDDTEDE